MRKPSQSRAETDHGDTLPECSYAYDKTFYKYIQAGSSRSAHVIAPLVVRELGITSVLDVGCGAGAWVAEYIRCGVNDGVGLDGSYVDDESLLIPPDKFRRVDVAASFHLGRQFDFVQCVEVAEHIPFSASEMLVSNLVSHADRILFSAAVPGQGGENHINEQPYEFWRGLFAQHRYLPFDFIRSLLSRTSSVERWYRYNMLLYVRDVAVPNLPEAVQLAFVAEDEHIRDISPLAYRLRKAVLRRIPPAFCSRLAILKHQWALQRGKARKLALDSGRPR